ncbi:major histocompatibility complex class I-related gene protein-like isoform 2-T2 [Vipera latastei]
MPLCPACLLVLGVALGVSVPGGCCGSPSHSLRYSYLCLSVPSQGLPQFSIRGYLDDQPIAHYDTLTRKMKSFVPWLKEGKEEKKAFQDLQWVIGIDLEKLSKLDNQTGELHTWQAIVGCEDGNNDIFFHYGYDGMDFLSFKKETLRWVVGQPQAEKVKEEWEHDPEWFQKSIFYLNNCIRLLQRYLSYRKEALEKTEPPVGKVTRKANGSLEVLICQTYGFYPKEIQATWTRGGENWEQETIRRNVAPNSDGTYYVWISIEIEPKERDRYQCRLEHDGLQEPLVLPFKEETAAIWWKILLGIGIASLGAVFLFLIWKRWRHRRIRYQEVRTSPGDFPLVNVSVSSTSGTEDEIQPESLPQSEDRASCEPLWPQRVLEDPESTLRRREGKQRKLERSQSWAGNLEALGEAGVTRSILSPRSLPKSKNVAWIYKERYTEFDWSNTKIVSHTPPPHS